MIKLFNRLILFYANPDEFLRKNNRSRDKIIQSINIILCKPDEFL